MAAALLIQKFPPVVSINSQDIDQNYPWIAEHRLEL
jgi:hypothetical protein